MNPVAKKLKLFISDNTETRKPDNKPHAEGWIERLEGQDLIGWIALKDAKDCVELVLNGKVFGQFTPSLDREDLGRLESLPKARGFSIPLLPTDMAEAIKRDYRQLTANIYYQGKPVKQAFIIDLPAYFKSIAEKPLHELNPCLLHLPLLTTGLIEYLDVFQILSFLDNIYQANLQKDATIAINTCLLKLEQLLETKRAMEVQNHTRYVLEQHQGILIQIAKTCSYRSTLARTAQQIISNKPINDRRLIHLEISTLNIPFAKKINLFDRQEAINEKLKGFKGDLHAIYRYWLTLDDFEQSSVWHQFANTVCFFRQPEFLCKLDPKWHWFTDTDAEATFEQAVDCIIEQAAYKLPLIIRTAEQKGYSSHLIVGALKKLVDHIHKLGWNPLDFICDILLAMDNDSLCEHYEAIDYILCHFMDFHLAENPRLIMNVRLIQSATTTLNAGFSGHKNIWQLFAKCNNHYLLHHEYLDRLQLDHFRSYDTTAYFYYRKVLKSAKACLQFFNQATPQNFHLSTALVIFNKLQLIEKEAANRAKHFIYQLYHYCKLHIPEDQQALLQIFEPYLGAYDKLYLPGRDLMDAILNKNEIVRATSGHYEFNRLETFYRETLEAREKKDTAFYHTLFNYLSQHAKLLEEHKMHELELLAISEYHWAGRYDKAPRSLHAIEHFLQSPHAKTRLHALAVRLAESFLHEEQAPTAFTVDDIKAWIQTQDWRVSGDVIDKLTGLINLQETDTLERKYCLEKIDELVLFPYCTVLVYSCQAYMQTRLAIIRKTWVAKARKLGVNVRLVVGGVEQSHHDEDLVYLKVEDNYESLPTKSLVMFEYVKKHFATDYFHKIDDDCLLNIYAQYEDPAYIGKSYWGRRLVKQIGQVDRSWHQKKSSSEAAKTGLDYSPENTVYADGSTGYILSRQAIEQLTRSRKLPTSRMIEKSSYFEDKLVGDLLSQVSIHVNDDNYTSSIRRKVVPSQETGFWNFNLLPDRQNKVKVLHTEQPEYLRQVWQSNFEQPAPVMNNDRFISDRLIFSLRAHFDKEEAPLVHVLKRIKGHNRHKATAILVGRNETTYWQGCLDHHRALGIKHFFYIDNCSTDGSLEYMMAQPDVSVFITSQEYRYSRFSVNWVQAIMANYCIGQWVLVLDADELFVYDQFETRSIDALIDHLEAEGKQTLLSVMVDFYPDKSLHKSPLARTGFYRSSPCFDDLASMHHFSDKVYGAFSNSALYIGGLRERIFGNYNPYPQPSYLNQKYCLFKYSPEVEFVEGIHFQTGRKIAEERTALMHFKYHDGFTRKVQREIDNNQHWNGSKEYKCYLGKIQTDPELNLFDTALSRKYINSQDLVAKGYMTTIPAKKQ